MGNTTLSMGIDRVILGCNALTTLPTRRAAFRLLDAAVSSGIRHFDTARAYGQGFSERILGEFLKSQGDSLCITTKLGAGRDRLGWLPSWAALPVNRLRRQRADSGHFPTAITTVNARPSRRIRRDELEQSIDMSLRCLQRSWIDVFLLHECLPAQLDPDARDFVSKLRAEGTLRLFGIGTARTTIEAHYENDSLCEVLQYDCPPTAPPVLLDRFPHVLHFHHSIFRGLLEKPHSEIIRESLAANPRGRVVFGTRRIDHLRANVQACS